jgi:hypothetical protein
MSLNPGIPISIRIAAWLVMIDGFAAVMKMALSLLHGSFNIDLGCIWIYAGLGLLRLSNGWRWFVIVTSIISLLVMLWVVPMFGSHGWPEHVSFLGRYPATLSRLQTYSLLGFSFVAEFFVLVVLWLPDVRQAFIFRATEA